MTAGHFGVPTTLLVPLIMLNQFCNKLFVKKWVHFADNFFVPKGVVNVQMGQMNNWIW